MDPTLPKVKLHRHPPERRTRAPVTLNAGCCCCCCCCCLHTLGSIVGAVVVPTWAPPLPRRAKPLDSLEFDDQPFLAKHRDSTSENVTTRPEELTPERGRSARRSRFFESNDEDVFDVRQPSRLSAVAIFWLTTLVLSGLFVTVYGIAYGQYVNVFVSLVLLVMVFPVVQVVASVVSGLILLFSRRKDKSFQLRQLGYVFAGVVLGTIAGFIAMLSIWAGFSMLR